MLLKHSYFLPFIFFIIGNKHNVAHSQFVYLPPSKYSIETNIFLAPSHTPPFWLYANQYGVVPETSSLLINARLYSTTLDSVQINWKRIKPSYAIQTATTFAAASPKVYLIEGFTSLKYGIFELFAGRRRETVGLLGDTLLSSGSYIWSGNALPIPKIQLSTHFTIPFTKEYITLSGFLAHGWLGMLEVKGAANSTTFVKGYLHQKALYTRIGKPNGSFFIHAGFNHQAQWGGERQIFADSLSPPSPLRAWWWAGTGKSWRGSRVGNHLGTIDLGAEWRFQKGDLFFYRQSIYEDGSLYHFLNIGDGLNGVAFRKKSVGSSLLKINKIVFEFLNTTSQGGDVFDLTTGVFGKDNYFNHYIYQEGWSYKSRSIGTPFINNHNIWPIVTKDFTNNNRVKLFHLATSGTYGKWSWLVKTSLSFNYGVYDYPLEGTPKQFSALFQLQRNLKWLSGLEWTSSVGLDIGKLYNSSVGIQVGLRKQGYF